MSSIRDQETIERQISELYQSSFKDSKLSSIKQLPIDMSPRRYFRIEHTGAPLVAMVFDSVAVPEAGGAGEKVDSFEAVVRLTQYLLERGVAVPKIHAATTSDAIIIEDDFGDTFLADHAGKNGLDLYKKAIQQIISLQKAEPDKNFFALKRGFTSEVFLKEMEETPDFYLSGLAQPPSEKLVGEIKSLLSKLAERVGQFEQLLSLRDFHSWNILVKPNNELGIIDFQDALLAPRTYDLVSLLNDRDTDSLLGAETYNQLLEYFFQLHPDGAALRDEYPLVLLQRDLKVAGRLSKMVKVRGLTKYSQWVPGTVRRIAKTLSASSDPLLKNLHSTLRQADPGGFGA